MHLKLTMAAAAAFLIAGQAAARDFSIDNLTARYGEGITWASINNAGELIGMNADRGVELRLRSGSVTLSPGEDFNANYPGVLGNDGSAYIIRQTPEFESQSWRRAPDGTLTPVHGLANSPYPSGNVSAVNDSGIAVGSAMNNLGYYRAVVYQGGNAIDLGTARGESSAYGINNNGTIVGAYQIGNYVNEAFIYSNGQLTTFGGADSTAKHINDANVVAGEKIFDNSGPMPHAYTRAFLYENGATTYISVDGKRDTHVLDLNNSGMVLGTASNGFEAYDYFLYFQGETILLKDILAAEGYAGWSIDGAIGLNDNDQLIVHALNNATGEARELLLSTAALPVPEPGTWAMLLAGLGCVGMLKRRARAA